MSDLRKFRHYIERESGREIETPKDVSGVELEAFLGVLHNQLLSKRSQARVLSALKAFFKFLELEGAISENPCDNIDSPKISRNLPSVLTIEEIDAIISSVDLSEKEGHRNKAIMETLYSCGLRVSELVNLRISDIFFDESFVRVLGKGDKQRLVPIGEPALKAIRLYLGDSRKSCNDTLFLNKRGGKLSREMIFLIVKRQTEMAGIDKEVSPHTFRHSFASHLVENGADLRVVQEMLGHESILTTEIYTHIDSKKWEAGILKFHPRK